MKTFVEYLTEAKKTYKFKFANLKKVDSPD